MMSAHNSAPPRHREWKLGCKVYIGNLADGASKSDIEDAFNKYGPLRNVWVARNPPGFAFVEFEDGRDAEDACRHLDGTRIAGGRIKAEMSHGRTRRGRGGGGAGGGGGPPGFRGQHFGGGAPYPPMNGLGPYGAPMRAAFHGGPPRGPAIYSNGGPYHDGYAGYRMAPYHGPPIPHPGMPPMHGVHHHGHPMDRVPRAPPHERHIPRPRSPVAIKDYRNHYSRSRSNSLGKSPPPTSSATPQQQPLQQQPPPPPPQQQQQQPQRPQQPSQQQQPQRTARPRTPPSRSPSPDRQ